MIAINYSTAREELKKYCDIANDDCETIVITRKNNENVVLMSESEYNNLLENLYIRSSEGDYKRILEAKEQLKLGKGIVKELIEDE